MEVWLIAGVAVVAAVAVFSLLNRRGGNVIDAPRQAGPSRSASAAAPAVPIEDQTAGDMLAAEGLDEDDPVVHFADWLESQAAEELGEAVELPGPTRRIADAARATMPVILAEGRGVVDLPALVVEASSARDFRRELDIAGLERAVADTGLLTAYELTDWRKDAPRVKALATWLDDQVIDDSPVHADMADDETVRVVEAARRAVDDIDRAGRADIALVAIGKNEAGQPFDVRRSIDAAELQTIVTEFEADERVTTRTRRWGP